MLAEASEKHGMSHQGNSYYIRLYNWVILIPYISLRIISKENQREMRRRESGFTAVQAQNTRLGWSKSLFGFPVTSYGKTQTNF